MIIDTIRNYFANRRERRKKRKNDAMQETACNKYQVTENNGELWLVFDSKCVCPMSMMKDQPIDALRRMRELYLSSNT